jgi:hypothetical protein
MQEKAEVYTTIGSQALELWRESLGHTGTDETTALYAQHSPGLWQRLWTATNDGWDASEVDHTEDVAVLLLPDRDLPLHHNQCR